MAAPDTIPPEYVAETSLDVCSRVIICCEAIAGKVGPRHDVLQRAGGYDTEVLQRGFYLWHKVLHPVWTHMSHTHIIHYRTRRN